MKVKELIKKLGRYKNKEMKVFFKKYIDSEEHISIQDVKFESGNKDYDNVIVLLEIYNE